MTTQRSFSISRILGWAALLIAPAMLGARGCDVAVVGSECGGQRGAACGSEQFCDFPANAQCGAADLPGTCAEIPEVSTQPFHRLDDEAPIELRLRALVQLLAEKGLLGEDEWLERIRLLLRERE